MTSRYVQTNSRYVLTLILFNGAITALAELSAFEEEVLLNSLSVEPNEDVESCAYTQTARQPKDDKAEDYVTTVSRYDPRSKSESPWELRSVDGRPPTKTEKRELNPERSGHPATAISLFQNLDKVRMELVSAEDDIWIFEGPVEGLDMEGPMARMQKKLTLSLGVHQPTSTLKFAKMYLKKPHRILLVARISKMEVEFVFGMDPAVDTLVATAMNTDMDTKVLGRSISISQQTTFADFECSDGTEIANEVTSVN